MLGHKKVVKKEPTQNRDYVNAINSHGDEHPIVEISIDMFFHHFEFELRHHLEASLYLYQKDVVIKRGFFYILQEGFSEIVLVFMS